MSVGIVVGYSPTERCWADQGRDDCGRPATHPLGLCEKHWVEIVHG
jgi:hypothetical protein